MKTIEIAVKKRVKVGKTDTRNLRKEENVPCVLYGGDKILHFYAHKNEFRKLVYTPDALIVNLDIEGEKHEAIMQALQFHPVTDIINHIDFIEVDERKPVVIHIPIVLTGSCIGVKNGGKLREKRRSLKVRGYVKDLPDTLEIDMTNVEIGNVIKVEDLSYPKIELLDPARSMVVSVISSRLAAKGMGEEEVVAVAPVEGAPVEGAPVEGATAKKAEK
jgi:large subunit ribosomal protein L25